MTQTIASPTPMRVAVVNLTSGGFSGGYRKYLREIIPYLRGDPRVSCVSMIGPSTVKSEMDWHWPVDDARHGYRALCKYLDEWQPDVVFIPTARSLRWRGAPIVTMVRNMEPLIMPFSAPTLRERARNVGRYLAARSSSRRATRVIAVSEFVRSYLETHWHIPPESIGVVTHGVNLPDVSLATRPDRLLPAPGCATVFAAGSIRPARGIEDLLDALRVLRNRGRDTAVWFGGAPTPGAEGYYAGLRRRAETAGVASHIQWLGGLTAAEMNWCFAHADTFVMTSRVEACPNTVLEALAAGARSISTRLAPMPEFYGDTATYYDAGDGDSLASALEERWSESPEMNDAARAAARQRASLYRWDAQVHRTVSELQAARASWVA